MIQSPNNGNSDAPLPFRSHTALLLATALPFLQPSCRHPVELITKFLEFSETIKLYQEFHGKNGNPFSGIFREATNHNREEGLFGLINTFVVDIEGLLQSLSCVCTGGEKEIISMFLNLIRAKNFYETYGDLLNMSGLFSSEESGSPFSLGNLANLFGGTSFSSGEQPGNPQNAKPYAQETPQEATSCTTPASGSPIPEGLTSMLSDDQKETLNLLKSLFAED